MVSADEDGIVIHPAVSFPIEMYSDARIAEFDAAEAELAGRAAGKRT